MMKTSDDIRTLLLPESEMYSYQSVEEASAMDGSACGRLSGSEIHGFHTMEDLDVPTIMEEAGTRWLRPNEIHAILCNYMYFPVSVKPVNLPQSGTIVLFDRKMLRNFRKDGHNWKKKKDGKTVKEAHEHLKVGDEERIHVYYAHGQDNPNFVRRCYWLLDKKQEHIVLVHYRETLEPQGSPVTLVNSNSSSAYSDPSVSRVSSEENSSGANHAFHTGSGSPAVSGSAEVDDHLTVLHEINTLEWEDLLGKQESIDPNMPKNDEILHLERQKLFEPRGSIQDGSFLPTNNLSMELSSFGHPTEPMPNSDPVDIRPSNSHYLQTLGQLSDNKRKDFERTVESFNFTSRDTSQTQDNFGRWMNCIMADSPGSLDGPPIESPISIGHDSTLSATTNHHQSSTQGQVFNITDVSPAWSFSTEETKVIVIGFFHVEYSHLVESNLFCVFGDACVPVEVVQGGVFRCMASPHNPGFVNLYLSLDGHTPISQVLTFEYRSPSMDGQGTSPEYKCKLEEFQIQLRLSRLLFSTNNSLNILSNKVSPNALKEAKKFAHITSAIEKDWAYLIKSIENSWISILQAKDTLFELTLKNKLQEWLLEKVSEGSKTTLRDTKGQGVIHLCAILGYTWAVYPYSCSGLSLDFRDAFGWTALHWAAYYGREQMVAVLLSAGAKPNLVTDPTPQFPGGRTAADLASENGFEGLAAYLAEKGLINQFNEMKISGNASGSLQTSRTTSINHEVSNEDELCLKDTLAAYRRAADAAAHIHAAFRQHSLKLKEKAVQLANPEDEARTIIAAMKIQHAFRNYDTRKKMTAAARIQYRFRTWKIRKDFLNMRRQAIKIQAVFRGYQVRRQYGKILWSVGILEKAILRWRLKRKGFRGLQVKPIQEISADEKQENDAEEDFFRVGRKQAEKRVERSVIRVQAMFRSKRAQQEYRRMKMSYDQAALEYQGLLDPEVENQR
ncbi:PREDICTED: calmodulin-binding transcription activator 5-like isoform X2 [Nelumbo nucifera]|uniref:Calmodulin-binding transcription activator 5-like isoform X2 n=1 Tax=Nelumbo nucifera TaxID=4432 RepID=A0A1U8AK11_NELNU|nr:PREDICTED: calmodulin-binding transcription activator 5-like isoform X2 [Nelumbo nucifera]